jgi:hypothetical protein
LLHNPSPSFPISLVHLSPQDAERK